MTLGIVCGYRAEERIAARITPLTAIGWQNPDAAAHLIQGGATFLLSFGVAGGLDPRLAAGDLLLPQQVLVDGSYLPVAPAIHASLIEKFPAAWTGPILASPIIVTTASEKRRLFDQTNAIAADMESAAVARAAVQAGIAFAVVRTVSDPAGHTLPPAALDALTPNGDIDYMKVIVSLLRDPLQLPALIRTGRQNKAALGRLDAIAEGIREVLV